MTNKANTPVPPPAPPVPESVFTAEGAPPPGHVGSGAPDQDTPQRAGPAVDAGAHDPARATPISRSARIVGFVEVRQGDGSAYSAPAGPCTVQITALDAILSWVDGDTHGAAAMPLADFNRYLLERSIVYTDDAGV